MDVIEIIILVYLVVIMIFMYAGLLTTGIFMEELQNTRRMLLDNRDHVLEQEGIMLESIQDLDTSIRENTIAMTAHIDSMLEGVDDEFSERVDL